MSTRRNVDTGHGAALAEDVPACVGPPTRLGRALAALRAEIISSGALMLDDRGLEEEIAERRGGYYLLRDRLVDEGGRDPRVKLPALDSPAA